MKKELDELAILKLTTVSSSMVSTDCVVPQDNVLAPFILNFYCKESPRYPRRRSNRNHGQISSFGPCSLLQSIGSFRSLLASAASKNNSFHNISRGIDLKKE